MGKFRLHSRLKIPFACVLLFYFSVFDFFYIAGHKARTLW